MGTDNEPDDDETGGDDKSTGGGDELAKLRQALKRANAEAAENRRKLKELEDRDKSDTDKLREQVETLTKDLAAATARADRLDVALSKGLTASQAKRLVGSTREELEQDAAEILEAFPTSTSSAGTGGKPAPTRTPNPQLRGGSDPADEPAETDPAKLAASVPRF